MIAITTFIDITSYGSIGTIENSEIPEDGIDSAVLREVWRIGGDSGTVFWGKVESIIRNEEGDTYILDRQRKIVQVIDVAGVPKRTIGRAGEGPGEFQSVGGLYIANEGTIGVSQVFPGKIVRFNAAGDPLPNLVLPDLGGLVAIEKVRYSGYTLLLAASVTSLVGEDLNRRSLLFSVDEFGGGPVNYFETTRSTSAGVINLNEIALVGFTHFWDVGRNGRVFVSGDWNEYSIRVYDSTGSLEMVILRDYQPSKRTAEEIKQRRVKYSMSVPGRKVEFELARNERCIKGVYARPSNTLWVLTDRGTHPEDESVFIVLDEYNDRGDYVRQINILSDADLAFDEFHIVGDYIYIVYGQTNDLMYLQYGDESNLRDELVVSCCRIEWN